MQLLGGAHDAAGTVDAHHDGADRRVLAIGLQLPHDVVDVDDDALELDDGDARPEQGRPALAAPGAADHDDEQAGDGQKHQQRGPHDRESPAHPSSRLRSRSPSAAFPSAAARRRGWPRR